MLSLQLEGPDVEVLTGYDSLVRELLETIEANADTHTILTNKFGDCYLFYN
jgi:hypothetical protein